MLILCYNLYCQTLSLSQFMQKRTILNSPRLLELKNRRRKIFFNKIFLIFTILLLAFAGLIYVSRLKQLNISEVKIVGNKVEDNKEVIKIVERNLSGHYLWLFPKKNIFLYPKNAIKNDLMMKFNRFKDISLSIKDEQVLEVEVGEREGLYAWCGENLPTGDIQHECYLMDENGYIFAEAPYISGEVYFKFYGLQEIDGSPLGVNFLNENFQKFILFKKSLEQIGLKPVAAYTKDNIDIKLFLARGKSVLMGPQVTFKIDSDLDKLAENLQSALSTEPLLSNFKNKYSSLEYIDLRFGNKVYYKFR